MILIVIVVLLLVFLVLWACVEIVPQGEARVVERLGVFRAVWGVGLHMHIPILEKMKVIDPTRKKRRIDKYVIDLREQMQNAHQNGEYVYYRTDHHWTTKGAYMAYQTLMTEWGRENDVYAQGYFTVEAVDGFFGTTWSRAGLKFVKSETIELWHYAGEYDFTVTDPETGVSFNGFYNREYLEKKDKYSAFLDGTHGVLTVTKNTDEPRQKLLVLKDSFFNSMAPFLAQHYDLVVVNLSVGGTQPLQAYIDQYGCDGVLIVYNAENIIENNALAGLCVAK